MALTKLPRAYRARWTHAERDAGPVRPARPQQAPRARPARVTIADDGTRTEKGTGAWVPLGPAEMAEKSSVSTPLPTSNTATRRFSRQTEGSIGPT